MVDVLPPSQIQDQGQDPGQGEDKGESEDGHDDRGSQRGHVGHDSLGEEEEEEEGQTIPDKDPSGSPAAAAVASKDLVML